MLLQKRITDDVDTDYVITDVRFPNEAEAVKSWGGSVYKIDRAKINNLSGQEKMHASEVAMDSYSNWDGVIENNSTIEDFYNKAVEIIGL